MLRAHQDAGTACISPRRWRSCCGRRTRTNPIPTRLVEGFLPTTRSAAWSRSRRAPRTPGSRSTSRATAGSGSIPPAARPASRRARSSPDRASRRRPRRRSTPTTAAAIRSAARRFNLGDNVPATSPAQTQVGNRAVFAILAVLVALLVGGLAFAAWLRGPRGEINPDRAWQSMAKAAGRFGFAPRPNQTDLRVRHEPRRAGPGRQGRPRDRRRREGRDGVRAGPAGRRPHDRGGRRGAPPADHAAAPRLHAARPAEAPP